MPKAKPKTVEQENRDILERISSAAAARNRAGADLSRIDRHILGVLAWAPRTADNEGAEFTAGVMRALQVAPVQGSGDYLMPLMAAELALRNRAGGEDFAPQIDKALQAFAVPQAA